METSKISVHYSETREVSPEALANTLSNGATTHRTDLRYALASLTDHLQIL